MVTSSPATVFSVIRSENFGFIPGEDGRREIMATRNKRTVCMRGRQKRARGYTRDDGDRQKEGRWQTDRPKEREREKR